MRTHWLSKAFLCTAAAGALISCGPPDDGPIEEEEVTEVTCEGPKCDSLADNFRDAYDDMTSIDLDDLALLSAGLATDELNGALDDVPYSTIALTPTAVYGQEEELLGQTTVHDINGLRAGLTERFGEHAFATDVVEMRQKEAADNDVLWGESHFEIGPSLGHNWSFDAGDDIVGSVGFTANANIETVVIAPYEDKTEAVVDAPLAAISETRGWIMPRSYEEVTEMTPGESLSMRAEGALGLNLGVGVPFLVGTIADTILTIHARLSLGAKAAVAGTLDVQLVRGEGDDIWVDVGMDKQTIRKFSAAINTGFGVESPVEVELDLGVINLDVDNLAERALRKQLDQHLAPSFSATSRSESMRLTVARFRFDASMAGDPVIEQALAQSMRGDIRLAQALAIRPDSGVNQVLDLTKDARSEANYVGFRFLGMEFYRASDFNTGTVTIEDDGGNQTLLFSEMKERSGFFFTDREWEFRKLVSIKKDNDGILTDAAVNSRMTIRETDSFLARDQMLDHVDPMVGYFTGFKPLWEGVGMQADQLAHMVDHEICDSPGPNADFREKQQYQDCLDALPTHPDVVAKKQEVQNAIDTALAADLRTGWDPAFSSSAEMASKLLQFKLEASARNDRPDVGFYGPEGKMVTQIRFSNTALEQMMVPGRHEDFQKHLENVLRLQASERSGDNDAKQDDIDDYVDDRQERLDELGQIYGLATVQWADLNDTANMRFDGERIGNYGHLIILPEEDPENGELDAASIAEHKGRILEETIPELVERAEDGIFGDLDEPTQFVMAYALLYMADPSEIELLVKYVFNDEDDLAFDDVNVYSRGTEPLIDAGQFDLDQLLGSQ